MKIKYVNYTADGLRFVYRLVYVATPYFIGITAICKPCKPKIRKRIEI